MNLLRNTGIKNDKKILTLRIVVCDNQLELCNQNFLTMSLYQRKTSINTVPTDLEGGLMPR